MNVQTIQELIEEAASCARDKGWEEANPRLDTDLLLLHSEISEACEDMRKHHEPNVVWFEGQKPCGIPTELADLMIRVAHISKRYGIDLVGAINTKMAYNRTRPHRHGGKAF